MTGDVERVIAAMAAAWDSVPGDGKVADLRHALAAAAMAETRRIDAEAIAAELDDVMVGDWLLNRAQEAQDGTQG